MAAISQVLQLMDGIADYAAGQRPRETYSPHPSIQVPSSIKAPDINRSAYEALQKSISAAVAKQQAKENPVKDYEAGKTSFQDMLKKLEDKSGETKITEIYLQKKNASSASNYTAEAGKTGSSAKGTLVDMEK